MPGGSEAPAHIAVEAPPPHPTVEQAATVEEVQQGEEGQTALGDCEGVFTTTRSNELSGAAEPE